MTDPKRDQKLIFSWDNGIDIFENLTRKEVKEYETMSGDEKIAFIEKHEKDSVFYPNEMVYFPEGDCTFDKDESTEEDTEKYFENLHEYILDNWKEKGPIEDEENAKFNIETIIYLLCNYRLNCLLSTILDIESLWEKFDEE